MGRIVVHGYYGKGNLGDDVLLEIVAKLLAEAGFSRLLRVSCWEPARYLREWYPDLRLLRRWDWIRGDDVLIYGGGTQYFSFPSTASAQPSILRSRATRWTRASIKKVAVRWRSRQFARARRVGAIGVGLGPFATLASENNARNALARSDFLWLRDSRSLQFAERWGLRGSHLSPDLSFLYFTPAASTVAVQKGKIAMIPRDWPHSREGSAHLPAMLRAAELLEARGFMPEFLVFEGRRDRACYREIVQSGRRAWVWDPDRQAIHEALLHLRTYDVAVSARYHGVILPALVGVIPVAANIEPKLAASAEALGGRVPLWNPPFHPEELVELIESAAGRNNVREQILVEVERQRARAQASKERFLAWLDRQVRL